MWMMPGESESFPGRGFVGCLRGSWLGCARLKPVFFSRQHGVESGPCDTWEPAPQP